MSILSKIKKVKNIFTFLTPILSKYSITKAMLSSYWWKNLNFYKREKKKHKTYRCSEGGPNLLHVNWVDVRVPQSDKKEIL